MLSIEVLQGLLLPFLGTALGAAGVYVLKKELDPLVQKGLTGFAAGVMVAASVWSLLIPAMEAEEAMGNWAFLPAVIGFWAGTLFLLALDHIIPHLHLDSEEAEGPQSSLPKSTMLLLAVTLHNIPEGMAVGVVLAGWLSGATDITLAAGMSRHKAFLGGMLSGIVEPIGGLLTILAASFVIPVLPYLLAFAAGAMLYVVVEEMIPEMSSGHHSNVGVLAFAFGFTLMMALDVALG